MVAFESIELSMDLSIFHDIISSCNHAHCLVQVEFGDCSRAREALIASQCNCHLNPREKLQNYCMSDARSSLRRIHCYLNTN